METTREERKRWFSQVDSYHAYPCLDHTSIKKLIRDADLAEESLECLRVLADEAVDSVEYSDWPELQDAVKKANDLIDKARGEKK